MLMKAEFRSTKPAARDFPVALDLQYQVLDRELKGAGRTMWISSKAVIFEADREFVPGTDLEMTVAWPARLDERIGLQLWLRVRVVHSLSQGMTAEIRKYQFRTRSLARQAVAARPPAPVVEVRQVAAAAHY
jgi:hypothetical protein